MRSLNKHHDSKVDIQLKEGSSKKIKHQLNYAISQVDMLNKSRFLKREINLPEIKNIL